MNIEAIMIILSAILSILWGVLLYLVTLRDKKIKEQSEIINRLSIRIELLEDKIWDEAKLEKVIHDAIKNEFNCLKIELMEKGVFK